VGLADGSAQVSSCATEGYAGRTARYKPAPFDASVALNAGEYLKVAHRVISLLRSKRVALGAKRTPTSMRHATKFMSTRPWQTVGAATGSGNRKSAVGNHSQ